MKRTDLYFLIDQLSNSMELYELTDFIELSEQTKVSESELETIFNEYWKLPPISRFEYNQQDWIDFINSFTNG